MASITTEHKKPHVAIIICSSRKPRVCTEVATFVHETFQAHASEIEMDVSVIDIADWPLPFLDEPKIPSQIKRTEDYEHEHTRRWSTEIAKYQGFVFVTPQYNWGVPAPIKNAMDFLFHEWNAKSGLVISYGGRGGGKAGEALRQVLQGVRMHPCETQPQFVLSYDDMGVTTEGKEIGITGPNTKWKEYQDVVIKGFKELEGLMKEHPL